MNAPAEITPILGTSMDGGFYAGRIRIDGHLYALIVAPKSEGEHKVSALFAKEPKTPPLAHSYCDGLTNTEALMAAGSKLAKWSRDLEIAGHRDWYLPSQDELEVIYRNLKPTTRENWCYYRSGINLHAATPTLPYVPDSPTQTEAELFRVGGSEAFEAEWYWTSTIYGSSSSYAWYQHFNYGNQGYNYVDGKLRARAVRRLPI